MSTAPDAGYSGTPLVRKLGIKAESRVALVRAPNGFGALLAPMPPDVVIHRRASAGHDVIIAFCRSRAELQRGLPTWRVALVKTGGLWISWPKRASGISTDLGEGVVRQLGLAAGLVDNKVCAIDATWSGLRFVYRLADRGA